MIFAVCRHALDCPFAIYISFDAKTHSFLLRRYNAQCIHMESSKRHLAKSSEWSSLKYSTILRQPNVSSSVIISMIKEDLGIDVTPSNICRARKLLVKKDVFEKDSSFQYLRSYCSKVIQSGGVAVLELHGDNTFKRIFICHEACIFGFTFLRKIVSLDGAHTKNNFKSQILTAVGLDSENQLFIVAFSIVDVENIDNWTWFLTNLMSSIGNLDDLENSLDGYHFISDRHKGLLTAVERAFPKVLHLMCMKHLERNIRRFCRDIRVNTLFKKCVYSRSLEKLTEYMNGIRDISLVTYNYLLALDCKLWTNAVFTGPRYGIVTSNSSESLNNKIMKFRHMLPLGAIKGISTCIMEYHFERRNIGWTSSVSKKVSKILTDNSKFGRRSQVSVSSDFEGIVTHNSVEFRVNLTDKFCSCERFQDMQYPCSHACGFILSRGLSLEDYVSDFYKRECYSNTYSHSVPAIVFFDLDVDESDNVKAPQKIIQRGKPKRRRIESSGER
ncbi:unnamed protein product [Ectocarpus fasciculatus]